MFYYPLLGADKLIDGDTIDINGIVYTKHKGILRQNLILSTNQTQTEETFGFKWKKRDTYESESVKTASKSWLIDRYLNGEVDSIKKYCFKDAKILDAGCGSGFSSLLLFGKCLKNVKYLGADISELKQRLFDH